MHPAQPRFARLGGVHNKDADGYVDDDIGGVLYIDGDGYIDDDNEGEVF